MTEVVAVGTGAVAVAEGTKRVWVEAAVRVEAAVEDTMGRGHNGDTT